MKPITPFDNFPSFANGGSRSAPGDAKYALGFVPADTLPAEWANYFFHGATKGVSDLNSATRSLWQEMNSVLSANNITPDADDNTQLLQAIQKMMTISSLAAHPVGSIYITSSSENPATTFGGGTWVQIKDKFILAAGDTYSNGATGGAATVTLTTNEIPSHYHTGTTDGGGVDHTHNMEHRHYTDGNTSTVGDHTHSLSFTADGVTPNAETYGGVVGMPPQIGRNWQVQSGTANAAGSHYHSFNGWSNGYLYNSALNATFTNTGGATAYVHTHGFTTNSIGGGQAHNNMPPYITKYVWERTA